MKINPINIRSMSVWHDSWRITDSTQIPSFFVVKQFRENRRCKYRMVGLRLKIEIPPWRRGFPSALNGWKYESDCYWRIFLHLTLSLLCVLRFLLILLPNILLLPSIVSTSTLLRAVSRRFWVLRECISYLPGIPRTVVYCEENFVWTMQPV